MTKNQWDLWKCFGKVVDSLTLKLTGWGLSSDVDFALGDIDRLILERRKEQSSPGICAALPAGAPELTSWCHCETRHSHGLQQESRSLVLSGPGIYTGAVPCFWFARSAPCCSPSPFMELTYVKTCISMPRSPFAFFADFSNCGQGAICLQLHWLSIPQLRKQMLFLWFWLIP